MRLALIAATLTGRLQKCRRIKIAGIPPSSYASARDHAENGIAVRFVECLHDLCLVCAFARHEGQALDDRGVAVVVDRIFRIHDPGAGEPHRPSGDVGVATEDPAGGDLTECVRAVRDFFHEGENHLELRGGRALPGGRGVFHVPQVNSNEDLDHDEFYGFE